MSGSVQRLEALLQRVQHNRTLPRAAAGGASVHTSVGNPAPAPFAAPVAAAPARAMSVATLPQAQAASVAARPTRDRLATPLEMAVEGELNRPAAVQAEAPVARAQSVMQEPRRAPAQEVPRRVQEPQAPTPINTPRASVAQQPARQPVQAAQPTRIESSSIAPPSKAIANVVSKHPSTEPASFGQLLARSLRLRPR